MAKAKAKKTVHYKSKPATTRSTKLKKKSGGRSKQFLSETWATTGKAMISGALGGGASLWVDMAFPARTVTERGLIKILNGGLMAKFMGAKNFGAGMAGAGMSDILKPAFGLAEGGGNWAKPVEPLPMYLSSNGMALSADQAYLLSNGQQAPNQVNYLPDYMPNWNY